MYRSPRQNSKNKRSAKSRQWKRFTRRFEPLEDRRLLATLTVTTTIDELDGGTLANPKGPDGLLSLREAIQVANLNLGPDTILLPKGSYLITRPGAGEDANQTGDFDILDSLTIKMTGKGSDPIIDGNGQDRVFNIPAGHDNVSLSLVDVVVQGGISRLPGSGDGGGIAAESNNNKLSLTNTTVTNNIATSPGNGHGGGIYNLAGDITLVNSHVDNNHADAGVNGSGGGIFLGKTGVITIKKSTVNNNSAFNGGGGIESVSLNAFTVTDSQFINNHAGGDGGGAEVNAQFVTINGSTFNNNTSGDAGGGLDVDFGPSGLITICKSNFLNNSSANDGGAVYCDNASVIVSGSLFKDNTSNTAIPVESGGGAIGDAGAVTATDSSFIHNVAVFGSGGAIYQTTSGDINITRCTFTSNSAGGTGEGDGQGGAIKAERGTGNKIYLTDSKFSANNSTGNGGAIYADEDAVIVVRCTFKDNVAGDEGGGIGATEAIQVTDSTFDHNVAGSEGGALQQLRFGQYYHPSLDVHEEPSHQCRLWLRRGHSCR